MKATKQRGRWGTILILISAPPLLLGLLAALQWATPSTARAALIGVVVTTLGGGLTGIVAERYLHRGRSEFENVAGLIATTALGVLTIGYLYLAHIRGPMASIGTLPRAIRQGLSFVAFLTGQGAGILLAQSLARPGKPTTEP